MVKKRKPNKIFLNNKRIYFSKCTKTVNVPNMKKLPETYVADERN